MTNERRWVKWIVILWVGIVAVFVLNPIVTVPAGHRGVLLTWGAVEMNPLSEGLHIITPIAQRVDLMEIRTLKYQADADAASKDLQQVTTTIALNYHIDPSLASRIYQTLSKDYQDRIIIPAIEESVKASTARFTAEELITKRPEVKIVLSDVLKNRLSEYGIIVETTSIVNFKFSDVFDDAIEAKVTAEQEALTAQRTLEKVKFEAQQNIEAAKGETEAIRIITEELKRSPEYLQWKALEKWDGVMPLATGGAMPFIDIGKSS